MFASKVDGVSGGGVAGFGGAAGSSSGMTGPMTGPGGGGLAMIDPGRERKLSSGSGSTGGGGGVKNKWMKAFKGIKGNKEQVDDR